MKKTESVRHEETREAVTLICDICGASTEPDKPWDAGDRAWAEVTISLEERTPLVYGGPDKGRVFFDLCPGCFRSKLVPWLESQGAKPTIDDIDW